MTSSLLAACTTRIPLAAGPNSSNRNDKGVGALEARVAQAVEAASALGSSSLPPFHKARPASSALDRHSAQDKVPPSSTDEESEIQIIETFPVCEFASGEPFPIPAPAQEPFVKIRRTAGVRFAFGSDIQKKFLSSVHIKDLSAAMRQVIADIKETIVEVNSDISNLTPADVDFDKRLLEINNGLVYVNDLTLKLADPELYREFLRVRQLGPDLADPIQQQKLEAEIDQLRLRTNPLLSKETFNPKVKCLPFVLPLSASRRLLQHHHGSFVRRGKEVIDAGITLKHTLNFSKNRPLDAFILTVWLRDQWGRKPTDQEILNCNLNREFDERIEPGQVKTLINAFLEKPEDMRVTVSSLGNFLGRPAQLQEVLNCNLDRDLSEEIEAGQLQQLINSFYGRPADHRISLEEIALFAGEPFPKNPTRELLARAWNINQRHAFDHPILTDSNGYPLEDNCPAEWRINYAKGAPLERPVSVQEMLNFKMAKKYNAFVVIDEDGYPDDDLMPALFKINYKLAMDEPAVARSLDAPIGTLELKRYLRREPTLAELDLCNSGKGELLRPVFEPSSDDDLSGYGLDGDFSILFPGLEREVVIPSSIPEPKSIPS